MSTSVISWVKIFLINGKMYAELDALSRLIIEALSSLSSALSSRMPMNNMFRFSGSETNMLNLGSMSSELSTW
ncbi:hypothetical protein BpHYR1_045963 [Brachionus plicatilis]|uniref:Uncharacterized protein n=1 Tax=Brachionus plicatilis TaxID=10195 RepID=A0A3M7T7B5_BRAPC|nr:hypothetical protein BpHYR1_045963 [Brachionus plicatilis]